MNLATEEQAAPATEPLDLVLGDLETEVPEHESAAASTCAIHLYCF
ncbi:hypothetical protein [Streptomyces sp. NPDC020983]